MTATEQRPAKEEAGGRYMSRLALTRQLAALCAEMDARLYIMNASSGEGPHWQPIVQGWRPEVRAMCASGSWDMGAAIHREETSDGHVALVTLAGSTTGYDVGAAVSMCSVVRKAGVDVLSVLVTRLLDQPLVLLVLRRRTAPPSDTSSHEVPSRPALASLAGFLAISPDDDDLMGAVDGRALMITQLEVREACCHGGRTTDPPPETLWLQWSWPGGHANKALDPVQQVQDAVGNTQVVHQRTREDRDGRVKGNARLLVDRPRDGELGRLAYAVERTVQQRLAETHRSPHEVQLRVVRDEGWLSQD